jgi:hypothetical protein
MGERIGRSGTRGAEHDTATWERRKAEQAARTAAAMAAPVSRFYLRHGRPVRDALPHAGTGTGDEEPGPA